MGVSETAKPLVRAQLLAAVNKPHGVSRRYSSKSMKGICSPVVCYINEPPGRGWLTVRIFPYRHPSTGSLEAE